MDRKWEAWKRNLQGNDPEETQPLPVSLSPHNSTQGSRGSLAVGRILHSLGVNTGNWAGINNPRAVSMASSGQDWELFMSVGLTMPLLMPNLCHWLTQALKFLFFSLPDVFYLAQNLPGCLSNIPSLHVRFLKKIPSAEFSPSKPSPNIPVWCVDILKSWGWFFFLHWALRNAGKGA